MSNNMLTCIWYGIILSIVEFIILTVSTTTGPKTKTILGMAGLFFVKFYILNVLFLYILINMPME